MIRWINNYIGTAPWKFAKETTDGEILDVRDLVDGVGNSNELVAEKIKSGVEIIQKRKKLIVCCEYGMSRSNAIAVGIICRIEKITFEQSLKLVISSTKEEQIKLSVLKTIKKIIDQDKRVGEEKRKKILIIDPEDYIGKSLAGLLSFDRFSLFNSKSDFHELMSNPAQLYLVVLEQRIGKIVFVSSGDVVNTNQFIGNLLFIIKNILDVSLEAQCDLIFISTIDVFLGYKKKNLTVKSTTSKKPFGNKGIAYSFAEDLIGYYKNNYKLNVAVLRIPVVYGEHDTKPYFIANFIRKAQLGMEIKIHRYINNLAWVNLIHVKDLAKFILEIIKKKRFGIYNIDGGEGLNTHEISKKIIKFYSSNSKLSFVELENNIVRIKVAGTDISEKLDWKPQENFYNTIKNQIHE